MSHTKRTHHPRALLLAGLCTLGGCLDDCGGDGYYDPTPGPGELGNGDFLYYCITDDDPACVGGPGVGNFPARIALGGRFRLQYVWDDANKAPPDLRSAVPDRLQVQGEIFTALATGYTAVLAVVANSDIGDLIHVDVWPPSAVAIQVDRIDYFQYTASVGQEVRFDAITRDIDQYTLAGALEFTWAIDDPSVAELTGSTGAHATFKMNAAGMTKLRASIGDLTKEIDLVVEDGVVTTSDASSGGTAGGSTDGTTDGTTGDSTGSTGGTTGDSSSGGDSSGTTGGVL